MHRKVYEMTDIFVLKIKKTYPKLYSTKTKWITYPNTICEYFENHSDVSTEIIYGPIKIKDKSSAVFY